MSLQFKKHIEDFVCENCGTNVRGNGYTNHCPTCLYSKHVDHAPGDRAHSCHALMEPIRIEGTASQYRIIHRCTRCGLEKRNNVTPEDDMNAVINIISRTA